MIDNPKDLLLYLKNLNLLTNKPKFWWPNYGTFEVVIGAILTQNTKWENVERSLANLKGFLEFEDFLNIDVNFLKEYIRPSGFYNQKAVRLYNLAQNIKQDFETFSNFQDNVTREWLLNQKGIGFESADSILCYACKREEFVVDSYTNRLLKSIGFEFESYDDIKYWIESGIRDSWDELKEYYEDNLNLCFARFHGKIVEFSKRKLTIG